MKKYKKLIIFLLIILMGLVLNKKFQWTSYILDSKKITDINIFVKENYLLAVIFYLIFTILGSSILALPGVTFAVLSSGLFGPWIGSIYCLLGTTIGAIFSFILSRYFLKDLIEDLVKKNDKLYKIIYKMDAEREMLILMITRLLPIFPFNLQNFAYGITNISIVKYGIGTFIFMIPGIIIFSLATEGLINSGDRNRIFFLLAIIVILMTVIGINLYKKYKGLVVNKENEG